MPYTWSTTPQGPTVLTLTAHRSLPREGFAAVILFASVMIAIPLVGFLGTKLLWGFLAGLVLVIWALWAALRRSYRDGTMVETLTRTGDDLTLTHVPVRGATKVWTCNVYWARVEIHPNGGPVENYVTLSGNGRTVEIGRFLSEDERKALFVELSDYLKTPKPI